MPTFLTILLISWLAGLASFVGGLIAYLDPTRHSATKKQITHGIIAFGGGILLAAVAFALIPMGIEHLSTPMLGLTFCAGGVAFCLLDIVMSRAGSNEAQLTAMLTDFLPEALSMGAVFAIDPKLGMLLAGFIAVQNLPEGFNAYREMVAGGANHKKTLWVLGGASLLGPLAAGAGHLFLRDKPELTAAIMLFAGGGILYIIFQDIAPQAKLKHHWMPTLGAVLGFAAGLLGKVVIG